MNYEIKINEKNLFWDDVFTHSIEFKKEKDVENYCLNLAKMFKCEVRLNKKGSEKGCYYNPR